jgi:hypothetical protein
VAAALDFVTTVMVIARVWRTGQAGRNMAGGVGYIYIYI